MNAETPQNSSPRDHPGSPDRGAQPAIDPASIAGLRSLPEDGGDELLARLAQVFREDADPTFADLRRALLLSDRDGVVRAAHTLKGSCAYFGAYPFQALCHEVEAAARVGNLAPAGELLPAIEQELQRIHAALAAVLSPPR